MGVVLGSAISTVPGYVQAGRTERRLTRAERERQAAELRLASRLVTLELDDASQMLLSESHGMPPVPIGRIPTSAWADHRASLAGALGPADWQRVTEAYEAITGLNANDRHASARSPSDAGLAWMTIRYAIGVLQLEVADLAVPLDQEYDRASRLWPGLFDTEVGKKPDGSEP